MLSDFEAWLLHIRDLGVSEAYATKPLLDGKMLAKALSTKPGPWMKDALDVVMAWQLRNPETATVEGAIEEVKNTKLHGELTASLTSHFLRLTIRPLFLKNQHPAVTAQGRRNTSNAAPKKLYMEQSDEEAKPWKGKETYALDLLRWIVASLDAESIERSWPLLIPPILSITDDTEAKFKAQGCHLITLVLEKTPHSLIHRTGLDVVFEEALMPCLGYLPALTPENESIEILTEVYPALIALSRVINSKDKRKAQSQTSVTPSIKLLDTVVRKGILTAYTYCSEHVKVMEVLLRSLSLVVNELGIESVKHLKHLLPMLADILSNPFGQAYPPTLLAGTKAIQCLVLNGWPRMIVNRGEVLRGITRCWIQVHEIESEDIAEIRKELIIAVRMLGDAVMADCDFQAELRELVKADPRLEGLCS